MKHKRVLALVLAGVMAATVLAVPLRPAALRHRRKTLTLHL